MNITHIIVAFFLMITVLGTAGMFTALVFDRRQREARPKHTMSSLMEKKRIHERNRAEMMAIASNFSCVYHQREKATEAVERIDGKLLRIADEIAKIELAEEEPVDRESRGDFRLSEQFPSLGTGPR